MFSDETCCRASALKKDTSNIMDTYYQKKRAGAYRCCNKTLSVLRVSLIINILADIENMRMRRKKNLERRIDEHSGQLLGYLIDYEKCSTRNIRFIREPLDFREIFGNGNPVHLEIGCGKGGFITEMASQKQL